MCKKVADLEKENAELKRECRRCIHTDCPCILSDYGKDRNGICDHFKDVFDENAELKEKYVKNITDCDICDTYCNSQLTKAKELLAKWVELFKPKSKTALPTPIQVDTEQFLKETGK